MPLPDLIWSMPQSETTKTKLQIPIMQKVTEDCATVGDAKILFGDFYREDQYKPQYLVGGSTGHSMIAEGENTIDRKDDYHILTNFYQSQPELGDYP